MSGIPLDMVEFCPGEAQVVSRVPGGTIYDRDLDTPHPLAPVEAEFVGESQRLVANPALMFLVWLLAYLVIRQAVIGHHLGLFFFGLLLPFVPIPLGQFHCLDCGETGWALRSNRHLCPTVRARYHGQVVSWLPIPRLRIQFAIWMCLAALALVLYVILAV